MKDCAIICCFNSGTSLVGGVVIFSVLGYMAHESGLNVEDVAEKGPGINQMEVQKLCPWF